MANAQVNNVVQIGGPLTSSTSAIIPAPGVNGLVALSANTAASSPNFYYSFSDWMAPTAQAQYTVPNGKTLVIYGHYFIADTTQVKYLFGNATAVTDNSATVPTAAIYNGNAASSYNNEYTSAANLYEWHPMPMAFPQNTLPFLQFASNAVAFHVIIVGGLV